MTPRSSDAWPEVVRSHSPERHLSRRLHAAGDEELRAVARAWRDADQAWRDAIFTKGAMDAMAFFGNFAGKGDWGGFIEFRRDLADRLGTEDAATLSDYIWAMVNVLWINTDPRVIPDPWVAAGLAPLHATLPPSTRA